MPCISGQNLAPISFAMCFPDVYEIRIPPGTTVVNLSILEKFQNSFSPDFIGI